MVVIKLENAWNDIDELGGFLKYRINYKKPYIYD